MEEPPTDYYCYQLGTDLWANSSIHPVGPKHQHDPAEAPRFLEKGS